MNGPLLRKALHQTFVRVLEGVDLRRCTAEFAASLPLPRRVLLLAAGKAAPAMALGAFDALGSTIDKALVVTTDGTDTHDLPARAEVLFASHPISDDRSVHAAHRAVSLANSVASDEAQLVLVSGGASALWCAPPPDVSLQTKQAITDALLRAGASIQQVNTVRRHLSLIKGGGLVRACRAPTFCGIASDVVGGLLHDVGSGPAVADPTEPGDACHILTSYLPDRSQAVCSLLRPSLSAQEAAHRGAYARILIEPESLGRAMLSALAAAGFAGTFSRLDNVSAEQLACYLLDTARKLEPAHAHVVTCEPTVTLPADAGRGGRAGWTALRCLPHLDEGVALLCGASDGMDGSSKTAGACVDGTLRSALPPSDMEHALRTFSDAAIHHRLATHIITGPTGLNLTDVYVLVRAPV